MVIGYEKIWILYCKTVSKVFRTDFTTHLINLYNKSIKKFLDIFKWWYVLHLSKKVVSQRQLIKIIIYWNLRNFFFDSLYNVTDFHFCIVLHFIWRVREFSLYWIFSIEFLLVRKSHWKRLKKKKLRISKYS